MSNIPKEHEYNLVNIILQLEILLFNFQVPYKERERKRSFPTLVFFRLYFES